MWTNEMAGNSPALGFLAVACVLSSCFLPAASLSSRFSTAFTKNPFNILLTLTFPSTSVTDSLPVKSTFCKVRLPFKIALSSPFCVSGICGDPFADSNAGLFCFLSAIKLFTALSVSEEDFRCLLSFGFFFMMAQMLSGAGGPSSNSKVRLLWAHTSGGGGGGAWTLGGGGMLKSSIKALTEGLTLLVSTEICDLVLSESSGTGGGGVTETAEVEPGKSL